VVDEGGKEVEDFAGYDLAVRFCVAGFLSLQDGGFDFELVADYLLSQWVVSIHIRSSIVHLLTTWIINITSSSATVVILALISVSARSVAQGFSCHFLHLPLLFDFI
jgi:hypothetical protein